MPIYNQEDFLGGLSSPTSIGWHKFTGAHVPQIIFCIMELRVQICSSNEVVLLEVITEYFYVSSLFYVTNTTATDQQRKQILRTLNMKIKVGQSRKIL